MFLNYFGKVIHVTVNWTTILALHRRCHKGFGVFDALV